jgi:hypothetical protein
VAAPALATVYDVEAILLREIDDGVSVIVQRLLELASARVRQYTRQFLSAVAADTVTLEGRWDSEIYLPEFPVTAISSIVLDGNTVDPSEYRFTSNGIVTRHGRWWGSPRSTVVAIYDHGYDPMPDDVVHIVADLVAEQYRNPDLLQQEQLGNYEVRYAGNQRDQKSGSIELSDAQKDALKDYRVHVTQTPIVSRLPAALQ